MFNYLILLFFNKIHQDIKNIIKRKTQYLYKQNVNSIERFEDIVTKKPSKF